MDLDLDIGGQGRSDGLITTAGPAAAHGGTSKQNNPRPSITFPAAPSGSNSPTSTYAESPFSPSTEKHGFFDRVRSMSWVSLSAELGVGPPEQQPAWIPTWVRPLPLVGIFALFLAMCCLFASLGVLIGSNGQPVDDWPWAPNVFLAILAAISNNSIHFALAQAVPVAWWYQASRGNTIAQLQYHWEAGQGLFRAIIRAPQAKVLAIAMIASTLVIVDGPFLQKSSRVVSETQARETTVHISLAPEMPRGASGSYGANGFISSLVADKASDGFINNRPIVANISGCEGSCRGRIRGPGVTVMDCINRTYPITRDMLYNASASWGTGASVLSPPLPVFRSMMSTPAFADGRNYSGPERMQLIVGMLDITNCSGEYVESYCNVQSMVMEYEVNITNNIVEFVKPAGEAHNISTANNTHIDLTAAGDFPTTFASLGYLLQPQIFSNVSLVPANGMANMSDRQRGALHMPLSQTKNLFSMKYMDELVLTEETCESHFRNPMPEMLSNMNNMMLRMGIYLASNQSTVDRAALELDPGLQSDQTIQADQTLTLNVFRTDLRWFAGAAVLEIIAILAIAPVFWGFWRLGLRVTMSPFEIANVFGAPLLKDVNSAAGSLGIVRSMGDVKVKFGAVPEIGGMAVLEKKGGLATEQVLMANRLAVTEAEAVIQPSRGMRFRY